MILEEFEAKYLIKYTPGDVESIRAGLQEYARLLESGEAFEDDYIVAHFECAQKEVYATDFENNESVTTFLNEISDSYKEDKDENPNLKDILFTETLFFMHALQYDDLHDEIKTACEAIVNYARKCNDSSKMWISNETCFGLEPLQLFACAYPEHGVLLASFMVPNWDDEHMGYAIWGYAAWVITQGLNEHTIKSFCYCDNIRARMMALGYDDWDGPSENMEVRDHFPLLKHLRASKENQNQFKEFFKERLGSLPLLDGYDSFDAEITVETYIFQMGFEMMVSLNPVDYWDDDFDIDDYMSEIWLEDVAQVELNEWADELIPFASFAEDISESEDDGIEEESEAHIVKIWDEFFCENFDDGKEIWKYIAQNEHPEVLDQIKEESLFTIINENCKPLKQILKDQLIFEEEEVRTMLEDWTHSLFKAWKEEKVSDDFHYERLIRFTDVMYRFLGAKKLPIRYKKIISDGFRRTSKLELTKRYPLPWKEELIDTLQQLSQYKSAVSKGKLERIAQLVEEHGEKAEAVLTEEMWDQQKARDNFGKDKMMSTKPFIASEDALCVSMYLYLDNLSKGRFNSVNDKAMEFIDAIALDCLIYNLHDGFQTVGKEYVERLEERDSLHDHEIEYCHKYYEWISFRDYIITGEFSPIKHFEVQPTSPDFAAKNLPVSQFCISDTQEDYNIIAERKGAMMSLLVFAEIAKGCAIHKNKQAFERVEKFFYSIAPLKMALVPFNYHLENGELEYYEDLESIASKLLVKGAPQIAYWSLRLYYLTRNPELRESEFMDMMYQILDNAASPDLLQAYKNMTYRMQLKALRNAKRLNHYQEYKEQTMEMFIEKLRRYMLGSYVIDDPAIYIHNRLKQEKIYTKYIRWEAAANTPELMDAVYNIDTGIQLECSSNESESFVRDKKGWGYLLLEKKGEELDILFGHELLAHIKNGFAKDSYYSTQTHLIMVDENCPKEFVEELRVFDNMDFRWYVYDQVVKYLRGELEFDVIETVVRYSTSISVTASNYNDFDFYAIADLFSREDKTRMLKVLSLISMELLEQVSGLEPKDYYKTLLQAEIDTDGILNYLHKEQEYDLLAKFAQERDISESIVKLKIADQIPLFTIVANYPQYHSFIISRRKTRSPKLKQHLEMLIEKLEIK
ncbi:hypothetical protein DF185_02170 [Marinifilum breve]|uniref:Uncharacterized protein n=1 Tax=Marinifilum breve TaxID=2184082 RepID=A0A2V4A2M1_9BACT|nr:hypothetical protein [Marinifilum breve]PXY02921.1 hypothetical protein DF185_02170 [Marinifilum breve]